MNESIKILGVKGHEKTEQLQLITRDALQELKMDIPIVNYSTVEDFIHFNLEAIPSIIFKSEVVFQKDVPEKEDLKTILKRLYSKRIVVPVDFSDTSKNALSFAEEMAMDLYGASTRIQVINIHNGLINTQKPKITPSNLSIKAALTQELKRFINPSEKVEEIEKCPFVLFGAPVKRLVEVSKNPETNLIVMGTAGENNINLERRIFGSIASEFSQKTHSPVLFIPPNAKYQGFRNILIASDNLVPKEKHLELVKKIASHAAATYHFVHIKANEKEELSTSNEAVEKLIAKTNIEKQKVKRKTITSTNTLSELNIYAENNAIDLIVVTTKHRNYWKQALHFSQSQSLIMHAFTPILVLHV